MHEYNLEGIFITLAMQASKPYAEVRNAYSDVFYALLDDMKENPSPMHQKMEICHYHALRFTCDYYLPENLENPTEL